MVLRIFTRVLQLSSAVALISVLELIGSTQAYAIGSTSRKNTAMGNNKESNSIRFLSDPTWRAQQLGSRLHGEDKGAIGESHVKKLVANLKSDERKENSPESLNSGSNSMSRSKRDASGNSSSCSLPANLPERVDELNSVLNNKTYLTVFPQQSDAISLSTNQPQNCPASIDASAEVKELRTRCPFIKEKIDNGPDAYPRYLIQAKCLCTNCVGQNSSICEEILHDVTFLRRKGCQHGLALMEEAVKTVVVGCICTEPKVQGPANSRRNPLPPSLRSKK